MPRERVGLQDRTAPLKAAGSRCEEHQVETLLEKQIDFDAGGHGSYRERVGLTGLSYVCRQIDAMCSHRSSLHPGLLFAAHFPLPYNGASHLLSTTRQIEECFIELKRTCSLSKHCIWCFSPPAPAEFDALPYPPSWR